MSHVSILFGRPYYNLWNTKELNIFFNDTIFRENKLLMIMLINKCNYSCSLSGAEPRKWQCETPGCERIICVIYPDDAVICNSVKAEYMSTNVILMIKPLTIKELLWHLRGWFNVFYSRIIPVIQLLKLPFWNCRSVMPQFERSAWFVICPEDTVMCIWRARIVRLVASYVRLHQSADRMSSIKACIFITSVVTDVHRKSSRKLYSRN